MRTGTLWRLQSQSIVLLVRAKYFNTEKATALCESLQTPDTTLFIGSFVYGKS